MSLKLIPGRNSTLIFNYFLRRLTKSAFKKAACFNSSKSFWMGLILAISSFSQVSWANEETLTVWAMGEEGLRISAMARAFEKENPGVRVVTQAIPWGAAHEKMLTAVVGGLPPDVSQMGTTWMAEFATLQALEPLEPFIETSQFVQKDKFFEGSWKTAVVNNRVYGIPWYVDTRVLFYRRDLLKEVGFDHPPATWDELKEVARLLARDLDGDQKNDLYGISLPIRGWGVFLPFVWQNGGDVYHPDSPEYEEALRFYVSFFEEGIAPGSRAVDTDLFQAFKKGVFPMFISGPWMVELIGRELPELDGKWGVSVVPGRKKRTSFVGGSNLVVFRDSKKKELAWKFVEFMSRPDIQVEWFQIMKSLPAVKEAWNDPVFKASPMLRVFGEQMKDTNSPPAIPEWEKLANSIDMKLETIILGQGAADKQIKPHLRSLQAEMDEVLSGGDSSSREGRWFLIYFLPGLAVLLLLGCFWISGRRKKKKGTGQENKLKRKSWENSWRSSFPAYFFISPAVIVLVLFLFGPVLISFFISLTDWDLRGLADPSQVTFLGFVNYWEILNDPIFWKSLLNTLVFSGIGVPITVVVSLMCAVALNEKIVRLKVFFRTVYFLPVVSTIVAVAVVWRWLYNPEYGLLNYLLKSISLPEVNWLGDPKTALLSLVLMAVWKNFGYNMVIFLAGLQCIPVALYESARIDGANVWQLFRHVTLPGLRTITVFVVIMTTIGYLQFFAEPYVMTKGGPLNSTMSIVLYMYDKGFKYFEMGYASALAYVLFVIIFLFTFAQIKLRKSGFETN